MKQVACPLVEQSSCAAELVVESAYTARISSPEIMIVHTVRASRAIKFPYTVSKDTRCTLEPDLIVTEMLVFRSKLQRNINDSDVMIVIP